MSTLRADTIQNTSGGAVTLTNQSAAKAWMQLNGTGTIAIQGSFNTSSATDNTTGDYQQNYTNALSNDNYSGTATSRNATNNKNYGNTTLLPTSASSTIIKGIAKKAGPSI